MRRTTAFLVAFGMSWIAQQTIEERESWNQSVKPFRIVGNVYYVGVSGVTSFLITTPQGSILLDGGFPETAGRIAGSIAELGFKISDVKYLLNSHAHWDHAGGLAELKRLSGAQMLASRADGETLAKSTDPRMPAVKVDRFVEDGATIELGGLTMTAHLTPGHTRGCTTWTLPVAESGKTYSVVFYCSTTFSGYKLVNNREYPQIVSDYQHSFAVLRKLPCDVFLAPHGSFFHLSEKRERMLSGGPNPFIDPGEMRAYVESSSESFQRELKKQRAAK